MKTIRFKETGIISVDSYQLFGRFQTDARVIIKYTIEDDRARFGDFCFFVGEFFRVDSIRNPTFNNSYFYQQIGLNIIKPMYGNNGFKAIMAS